MHDLTGLDVETTAVHVLTNYIEKEIKKVIIQSKAELKKHNNLKKIQGIYQKNRIDSDCLKNAIKTLNTNCDSKPASNDAGKLVKENKEDFEVQ